MAKKKGIKVQAKKKIILTKKGPPAKAVAKKTLVKKVAAKKAVVKKPVVKKAAAKKIATKKTVVKKAIAKKTVPKKLTTKKQPVPAKVLPAIVKQPVQRVKKAADNKVANIDDNTSGNELNAVAKTEDPLKTFDKHEFEKATSKGDPRSKLHLNNTSKGSIRPSGKKPRW